MKNLNIKIDILPNHFLKDDGTFDKDAALKLSGKIAGVCYDEEGFNHIKNEPEEKTIKRINRTLTNGHHSVYDHINIIFNLQNIPKILSMVLNNQPQYTTSEKSARYTEVVRKEDSLITELEINLYNKWLEIFKIKIKEKYNNTLSDFKIKTLAQENARYLITVFMQTQMIYTTSIRQINYIASWMQDYIKNIDTNKNFEVKLAGSMKEFINELDRLNVLVDGLMTNEKHRKLSLFGKDLDKRKEIFDYVYSTTYKGSFAQFAQTQRHRTEKGQMEMLNKKEYFIPPIIEDDKVLVDEWLCDIEKVRNVNPQGELVLIHECGKYDDFILKCKERLCTGAQLEIMRQTRNILLKYKEALEKSNSPLALDIENYSHGARCTFPDFECTNDCKFKEGKTLVRTI